MRSGSGRVHAFAQAAENLFDAGGGPMNWQQDWTLFKADVQGQWDRLTENDLDVINGDREALARKLQELYGFDEDEVEEEIEAFETPLDDEDVV
jgi:uncharacterized protein YjbJ (UPF0337 family)